MRSKARAGRHLGWSAADLGTQPYAHFWNPELAPLPAHVVEALNRGAVAEPLLPGLEGAAQNLYGNMPVLENGFTLTADGGMRVSVWTQMPGVTPAMLDWWFGWHSDSPERYKLWHPQAHVYAEWFNSPPSGSRGRARYVGQTSTVDEYLGSNLLRGAIQFLEPAVIGLDHPTLHSGQATIICARTGLADLPIDIGYLAHHVRQTDTGSEMRSRFWFGGPHLATRTPGVLGKVASQAGRFALRLTDADARALFVHCTQEMNHLAGFLPQLYQEFGKTE